MNKWQRGELYQTIEQLNEAKGMDMKSEDLLQVLEQCKNDLERIRDEQDMSLDRLPENLYWSSKGDAFRDAMDALDDACFELDEPSVESIDKAIGFINKAML